MLLPPVGLVLSLFRVGFSALEAMLSVRLCFPLPCETKRKPKAPVSARKPRLLREGGGF